MESRGRKLRPESANFLGPAACLRDLARPHLGDLVVGDRHPDPRVFYEWVRLAQERAAIDPVDGTPGFSGHVSVEIESCKSAFMSELSLRRLERLIEWAVGGGPCPPCWPDDLR